MKRRLIFALAALLLTGPMLADAAPDEVQKQLIQRTMESKKKLDAAQSAQGSQRDKLLQEHMDLMGQMMKQMHSARPGPDATPQQLREWIDEHMKLMDQMMSQMMQAEKMMMPVGSGRQP